MDKHYPVLLKEALEGLMIKPNGVYVDCTLGRAGHSTAILSQLTTGKLYCFEQDDEAINAAKKQLGLLNKPNFEIINANFMHLQAELVIRNVQTVNGILYDLGVSSPQLDSDYRGFSYRYDSELDMRMNQKQSLTAKIVVNTYSVNDLARIFREYGEEKFSWKIAQTIVAARAKEEISTTFQLVDIIKQSLPQKVLKKAKHPAKQVFQAIRIEVNQELEVLKKSLEQAVEMLAVTGRLVIISFHSLEDRIVKQFFQKLTTDPAAMVYQNLPVVSNYQSNFKIITKKVIVPTSKELDENHRSASAKMRILERVN
ncbi:16S rRNA (cytosine(1402)-N(4))-methyltransferase RsmH [Spiroplasma syrphidicola]|nr:16S rRNA (cytosine(1402)-N(4))-methyltransferase RsmH [Spiroplasma syrphidicola]